MPPHVNKLKRACRLCLMTTERHTRHELYVKSQVESEVPMDKDAGSVCKQNEFSNMILYEKVQFCCGIKLAPKSELPSKICGKCFYMIHMWFNFRQMSCNSQIVLASQTNIKLENDAISTNLSELQQMRNNLLNEKEIKDDEEIIVPDPEMCCDNKVSYSIEKVEDGRVDVLHTCTNSNPKSYDEEDLRGSDSKLDSEEESISCGRVKENNCSKSQDDEIYNSYEEEEDCLAEICIEEAILRNAHKGESLANDSCNDGNADLEHNKHKSNDQIEEEDECNVSVSMEKSQEHQLSPDSHLKSKENCNAVENNLYSEEDNVNDAEEKLNQLGNRELDLNTPNSEEAADHDKDPNCERTNATRKTKASGDDDHNEAIESNIDYLLAESDVDDEEQTNERSKSKTATTQNQRSSNRKKIGRKLSTNQKLPNENDSMPSKENSSANCKAKKTKSPRKFMCSICGSIHTDYLVFSRHVRTHSKERPFKCETCEKAFRTPAFLKRHMVVHTHDRRFKCKYCSRHYTEASSRHRHEKTHLDSPEFKCVICGKGFTYKTVLRRHIKLHSGEKEYSCGVCNTSFALPHHLKNHIKTIGHREKQKSYEALGFKVVFETRESLDT